MGARPAHQLRRCKAENVAARLLDVDYLSAELCELGADIGLGDQLPGADRTDALQWPERRRDARRFRSHKLLDPIRDGASSCSILSSSFTSLGSCGMQLPPVVGICNLWAYAIENFDSNQDRSRAAIGAPRRRNGPTFFVCRQASSLLLTASGHERNSTVS